MSNHEGIKSQVDRAWGMPGEDLRQALNAWHEKSRRTGVKLGSRDDEEK